MKSIQGALIFAFKQGMILTDVMLNNLQMGKADVLNGTVQNLSLLESAIDSATTVAMGDGYAPVSLAKKLSEMRSVADFGPVGTADDTAVFQAALDSGEPRIFVPPALTPYNVGQLTMPTVPGFVFEGAGTRSVLRSLGPTVLSWPAGRGVAYVQGVVRNLSFDGSIGTADLINTAGVGGIDLDGLYVTNIPVGFSAIRIDGDGATKTYTHDVAVRRCRIYDNGSGGHAGIVFGAFAADIELDQFIMNGNFRTEYCILIEAGCGSVQISGGHPYNAKINVLRVNTAGEIIKCSGVTFDNALRDIVSADGTSGLLLDGCRVQGVPAGYSGVSLTNCSQTKIIATAFDGVSGANAAVTEAGNSDFTVVAYPDVTSGSYDNFATLFALSGPNSIVRGEYRNNLKGYLINLAWCGQTTQAPGTVGFYGPNGLQSSGDGNAFVVPVNAVLDACHVYCSVAPGTGELLKIAVLINGTVVLSGDISAQGYACILQPLTPLSIDQGSVITLSVTSSAGANATTVRGAVTLHA